MNYTDIDLGEYQRRMLEDIVKDSGQSHEDIVKKAVGQYISGYEQIRRRETMRHARGIWRSRPQLPNLAIRSDRPSAEMSQTA